MRLFYSVVIDITPEEGESINEVIKDIRRDIERGIEKEGWAADVVLEKKEE